ncbi:hypothetical protein G7046_g8462 [Stylonectria norvegica]|nr:hypothetical protein G7046_g8462 [Stylonectria norvegica]
MVQARANRRGARAGVGNQVLKVGDAASESLTSEQTKCEGARPQFHRLLAMTLADVVGPDRATLMGIFDESGRQVSSGCFGKGYHVTWRLGVAVPASWRESAPQSYQGLVPEFEYSRRSAPTTPTTTSPPGLLFSGGSVNSPRSRYHPNLNGSLVRSAETMHQLHNMNNPVSPSSGAFDTIAIATITRDANLSGLLPKTPHHLLIAPLLASIDPIFSFAMSPPASMRSDPRLYAPSVEPRSPAVGLAVGPAVGLAPSLLQRRFQEIDADPMVRSPKRQKKVRFDPSLDEK